MKKILDKLSRIFCSGLLCAGIGPDLFESTPSPYAQPSYAPSYAQQRPNASWLDRVLKQEAEKFLEAAGFPVRDIPPFLRPAFDEVIEQARKALVGDGYDSLNVDRVVRVVQQKLGTFVAEKMRKKERVDNYYNTDAIVVQAVQDYMTSYGVNIYRLSSSETTEYKNRVEKIKQQVRSDAAYGYVSNLEKVIEDNLKVFAARVSNTYPSGYANYPQPPAPVYDPNKIARSDLDAKVTYVTQQKLRAEKIDSYALPSRADSQYKQAKANIIDELKKSMSLSGQNYVWVNDIERLADKELKGLIRAMQHRGASCSICLDKYVAGERVGVLNCGHNFHKDCIYEWFAQKKTCPVCYACDVIVAQQDTVP